MARPPPRPPRGSKRRMEQGQGAGAQGRPFVKQRGQAYVRSLPYHYGGRGVQSGGGRWSRGARNQRTGGYSGIELKFLDCGKSDFTVPAPTDCAGGEVAPEFGCTGCISAPAQGDAQSSRDGRRYTIKSVYVQGSHFASTSTDAVVNALPVVFVALVLDTQANAATIVSENVFTNGNDTSTVNSAPLRNLEYSSRYRVLDSTQIIPVPMGNANNAAVTTISQATTNCPFKLSWKGELPVTCNAGTTADVANITDNAIHVIAFGTVTANSSLLSYNSRVRFVG